ncbi:MAG: ribbon-helix-helix domain-containing protein [Candidatus Omnitrophota bacterium]
MVKVKKTKTKTKKKSGTKAGYVTNFKLDPESKAGLTAIAKEKYTTQAEILRQAVKMYLDSYKMIG